MSYKQNEDTSEEKLQIALDKYSYKAKETLNDEKKTQQIIVKIKNWLEEHKNDKIVGPAIDNLVTMVDLLSDYVHGNYREIPTSSLISIIAAIIYILSPIDLIPDWIPGIGLVDDVAVIAFVLKLGVDGELKKYRIWKAGREDTDIKLQIQAALSEMKGRIPSDKAVAAVFLTDDIKIEFLLSDIDCDVIPLTVRIILLEPPYLEPNLDKMLSLYKELIDKMDFAWSKLGKIEFGMERDYTKFNEHFIIAGN